MISTRIMVVEDERIVGLNLCNTLARLGYTAEAMVSTGEAALQRIASEPPDIVLMDIRIDGDMDGIDTAARIPRHLMIPVIYLTAYSEEATIERARATNPYGFLLKPFSERELNATIQMALGRRAGDIALREREEGLRLAMAAAEMKTWELDPSTGHILYKDHIGWSPDASPTVLAESFRNFLPAVHGDDRDRIRAAFDRVTGSDDLCEIEFRKTVADGKERWFRFIGKAMTTPHDRRRRIVGVSRDITDARLAAEELRASEEGYRNLISTIDGIVWELDRQTHALTYVSRSAERLLGYSAEQWMSQPLFWEEHLHPEDAAKTMAQHQSAVNSGNSYESTYRMIAADGGTVWVHEAVSTVVESDQRTVMRGVMVDVTSLMVAKQSAAATAAQLAEREKILAAVLDNLAIGIISVDRNLRIIACNREAARIFGYSLGGMLGQRIDHLMPTNLGEPFSPAPDTPENGGGKNNWRAATILAADGRSVPLTMITSEAVIAGETTMTTIVRDMTEVHNAEQTLQRLMEERERAVAQGEAANRAKASFLAVMSHELRTPLNAIIGFSDAISHEVMGPLGNEAYKGYVEDIHRSGELLLEVVNNILDLSRVEAGKHDFRIEGMSLIEAWKPLNGTMLANAAAKDITLRVLPPPRKSRFSADRNALSHILLNLVSNAIKFTHSGGSISISQSDDGGAEVAVCVSDNGRGIAADKLPNITKPFVQVSDTYVRDTGGVGLGLAICKSLTEAMSGRLVIESELGKGTTVRVVLPRAGRASRTAARVRRAPKSA